jgi:hypothetical protein
MVQAFGDLGICPGTTHELMQYPMAIFIRIAYSHPVAPNH